MTPLPEMLLAEPDLSRLGRYNLHLFSNLIKVLKDLLNSLAMSIICKFFFIYLENAGYYQEVDRASLCRISFECRSLLSHVLYEMSFYLYFYWFFIN